MPAFLSSYTKMDDFTAVVTATVLQTLPNLSKLMRLMDVWSIRLTVLTKVPPLLDLLDEVEIAIRSGWQALEIPTKTPTKTQYGHIEEQFLERKTFEVMRDVLQDKVTNLGRDLDYMLDTLEGKADTLPERWLDRMEMLEKDYGEWVVTGEKMVREGEWERMTKARKAEEARRKAEEEAREAAERKRREEEQAKLAEAARLQQEYERQEAKRIRQEEEAREAAERKRREEEELAELVEAARLQEEYERQEAERIRLEEEEILRLEKAARLQAAQVQKEKEDALRLEEEKAAEAARLIAEENRKRDEEALRLREAEAAKAAELARQAEEARLKEETALKMEQEMAAEAAKAAELARQAEVARMERENVLKMEQEKAAELARQAEEARIEKERVRKLEQEKATEAARLEEEEKLRLKADLRSKEEAERAAEVARQSSSQDTEKTEAIERRELDSGENADDFQRPEDSTSPLSDSQERHSEPVSEKDLVPSSPAHSALLKDATQDDSTITPHKSDEDEWVVIETPDGEHRAHSSKIVDQYDYKDHSPISLDGVSTPKTRSRNTSLITGYTPSEPSPQILQAKPTEYFRPTISPIKLKYPVSDIEPRTPSNQPMRAIGVASGSDVFSAMETASLLESVPISVGSPSPPVRRQSPVAESSSPLSIDGTQEFQLNEPEELRYSGEYIEPLALATSITQIKIPVKRIDLSRRDSNSSNASTIDNGQRPNITSSPVLSSPISVNERTELYDEFPSTEHDFEAAYDITPPGSPPPIPLRSEVHSLAPLSVTSTSSFADSSTLEPETPSTELSMDFSSTASPLLPSSPKKHTMNSTDDQIQAQISTLLESLQARIRLTSEPPEELNTFSRSLQNETLRVPRNRPSLGASSVRSASSFSMRSRASTPSFTLAPAYRKGTSRPRQQSNNPEIKLYHLSRSGEAPIKLFVRLVGENGERVMVRVGGGWADLGEYLKEYASHHGRRSGGKDDKVEIQDLGSRNVSGASMISSSSTMRGTGRTSPTQRSSSVLERDRPMSSLYVRKTRKSDADSTVASTVDLHSPSTPVVFTSKTAGRVETPPSGAPSSGRKSPTRLSAPDEGTLGLAGPKRKNIKISEQDAEWVESMKEKVRLASAGNELKHRDREVKEGRRDRGSFGDLDRVGGTKRLFKKGQ
jgi:hypothetical protein